jgi:hypothetical protein
MKQPDVVHDFGGSEPSLNGWCSPLQWAQDVCALAVFE